MSPGDHGWPGWLLCTALATFGVVLILLGVAEQVVPEAIRPAIDVDATSTSGRSTLALVGLCLVGLGWGVLRFRRWGWWGTVALGLLLAWPAIEGVLVRPLSGGTPSIPVFELVVVLGLPYLWVRRRDFGIGVTRHARPRGP